MMFVRYCELLAALSATRSQHAATVFCSHTLTETVLVHSSSVVGLKCSFHLSYLFILLLFLEICSFAGCKITHFFLITKEICEI